MSKSQILKRFGHWSGFHWSLGFGHWNFHSKTSGFTMVEVVVMMIIITTISGIVLVSFTGLHEGAALGRASRELALALRRMQNTSLAVTQVQTLSGPKIPSVVGVRLEERSPIYTLFADLTQDYTYDLTVISDEPDTKISENTFEGGVRVTSLMYRTDLGTWVSTPVAHLTFAAPEAAIVISDQDGAPIGEILRIKLAGSSGQVTKTITVRTSGQISIQ